MDEVLDLLIENGEMPAHAKEDPPPTPKLGSSGTSISAMSIANCSQSPSEHNTHHTHGATSASRDRDRESDKQLEDLLSQPDPSSSLFKMDSDGELDPFPMLEDFPSADATTGGLGPPTGILESLDTPLSPMDTGHAVLSLGEEGLDMEWAELTMPGSNSGLTPLGVNSPSLFSTDFLDSADLSLNTPSDLIF